VVLEVTLLQYLAIGRIWSLGFLEDKKEGFTNWITIDSQLRYNWLPIGQQLVSNWTAIVYYVYVLCICFMIYVHVLCYMNMNRNLFVF